MEAVWFKSGPHRGGLTGELPVVVCLSFCRRDVSDGLQQSVMVEPGHPFQGGQFHILLCLSGCATMNQLSLVQPVDRFGQRVVVAVPLASHRWLYASLGQAFAVSNADVLRSPIRVMNQAAVGLRLACVECLLQRIKRMRPGIPS